MTGKVLKPYRAILFSPLVCLVLSSGCPRTVEKPKVKPPGPVVDIEADNPVAGGKHAPQAVVAALLAEIPELPADEADKAKANAWLGRKLVGQTITVRATIHRVDLHDARDGKVDVHVFPDLPDFKLKGKTFALRFAKKIARGNWVYGLVLPGVSDTEAAKLEEWEGKTVQLKGKILAAEFDGPAAGTLFLDLGEGEIDVLKDADMTK